MNPTRGKTKVITIANQKGGTAKTTTAAHLAHGLARAGHQVLAIDLDTQGHLATMLGKQRAPGVAAWLRGQTLNGYAIVARPNLILLPGDKSTGPTLTDLALQHDGHLPADLLLTPLARLTTCDYVLLDTSPAATQLQALTMLTADLLILPAACDALSADSIHEMLNTLDILFATANKPPTYILPTFYDSRTSISRTVLAHYRRAYGAAVLPPIHRAAAIAEAASRGLTTFEHAPRSRAADEFQTLVHITMTTEIG